MKPDKEHLKFLLWSYVKHGSQESCRKFYDIFFPKLIRFSMMYVGNLEAAEDVVSEVFFKFFKMGRKIAEIDDVTYYLYRSVKNQSISYLRRNVHLMPMYLAHPNTEALGELSIDLHDPHQEFLKNDLQERLFQAIHALPKQKKTIYRLILFEGLKYKEVAELLNLSPKTVENHMIEATRKVRLAISHQMEESHQRLQSN